MTVRIAFVMPSLHRVHRGAEVALEAVAARLAHRCDVTLIGTGEQRPESPYRFIKASSIPRERFERFPSLPLLRENYQYEELTWIPSLLRRYRPDDFDATVGCTYPYTNWVLRARSRRRRRPPHIFVTQNGDWPAFSDRSEYAMFGCEGLVCTNPVYFERNQERWHSALIPNGIDVDVFAPGEPSRAAFGLPEDVPIVLMASALVETKRVLDTMRVVAEIGDAHFVVAGDGPLRDQFDSLGNSLMPGRFTRLSVPNASMPALYRSADVFVHAALFESFGNVYIEALAVGLPVIAHDNPATRWILGDHGILIDTQDRDSLGGALASALAGGVEGVQRRSAYARERFSWEAITARYDEFLHDVVDRARRR